MSMEGEYRFPRSFVWGMSISGGKEQAEVLKRSGCGSCLLSLEQEKIQPDAERRSEQYIDELRGLVQELSGAGIRTIISLSACPEKSAVPWESDDAPEAYLSYAVKTIDSFKSYVTQWVPLSDPEAAVHRMKCRGRKAFRSLVHMTRAYTAVYELLHRTQPEASVGCVSSSVGYLQTLIGGSIRYGAFRQNLGTVYNALDFAVIRTDGLKGCFDVLTNAEAVGVPLYAEIAGDINDELLASFIYTARERIFMSFPIKGIFIQNDSGLFSDCARRCALTLNSLSRFAPNMYKQLTGE